MITFTSLKTKRTARLLLAAWLSATLCNVPTIHAGNFKRITIDGSFSDWAGVPPAYVDALEAPTGFDFKEIYVANDESFLFVRVKVDQPRDFAAFHHQVIIDANADVSTGHPWAGVGSELLIEDGAPWQQKNGAFNEGAGSGLQWALAPTGEISEFEARISRDVRDAEGQPVFVQDAIALAFRVVNLSWEAVDIAPDTEGLAYEMAPAPPKATGSRTLVSLTGTNWRYSDAGTDPGSDWLNPDFDETQAGWKEGPGLLGFGSAAGQYPSSIKTTLAAGRTAYYFRAPFAWDYDSTGIALVVSNYVSDGAIIYLNGAELRRLRMPAGNISYSTLASGSPAQPGKAEVLSLPAGALVVGNNVLEVEVHATTATPQAIAFGLDLIATDSLPPSIEDPAQPADRAVTEGEATTFSAGRILGTEPIYYQWFKDGTAITDATNATFAIPVVLVSDAGSYLVEVSNATGAKVTSRAAQLTTQATPVAIADPSQPADRAITEGESTTFNVSVTGSPTLSYQWFKDGGLIEGATNAQHVIMAALLSDAGGYSVTISNRLGGVTSRTARLTVSTDRMPPQIAQVAASGTRILVTFSEPLDPVSAAQSANYSLTSNAKVQSAALDPADARVVTLTTTALQFGAVYTLSVSGVKDLYNNNASASAPFRASVIIDGSFDDWAGIAVAHSEPQDTAEGFEFKDFSVANDDQYLFIRFSFHAQIGQLPVDYYYHIFFDADNDVGTGLVSAGVGSEMMIENGGGYQQKNGGFNEGVVNNLDFAMGPAAQSSEFECRISRQALFNSDNLPVFAGPAVALGFQLVNTSWATIETVPLDTTLSYTFVDLSPMNPGPLKVQMANGQLEISWVGPGTLESRESLSSGAWSTVPNAQSPYRVSPTGVQRYYRLKL